ncbi:hypothetical protein Trydic_g13768 [Trypoxylus dichotomus]
MEEATRWKKGDERIGEANYLSMPQKVKLLTRFTDDVLMGFLQNGGEECMQVIRDCEASATVTWQLSGRTCKGSRYNSSDEVVTDQQRTLAIAAAITSVIV